MASAQTHKVFESLTEKQREALDLACTHYTSKQIARRLKIAPATADKRIDAVRAKLEFLPRADLLRQYAEWKQGGDKTTGDPIPLTETFETSAQMEPQPTVNSFRFEDALVFDARSSWDHDSGWLRPGLKPSDLSSTTKLLLILGGAIAILIVAVLSLAVSNALETAFGLR